MPKPYLHVERVAAIMKSRQDGATVAEIGRQLGITGKRVRDIIAREERDKEYLKDSPFKQLGLGNRSLKALTHSNFKTIEQVANASDTEMLMIPNIGTVTLQEIRKALRKRSEHPSP